MNAWAVACDPDHLMALMLVDIYGVGPIHDEWDRYIQTLMDNKMIGPDGSLTAFGRAICTSVTRWPGGNPGGTLL